MRPIPVSIDHYKVGSSGAYRSGHLKGKGPRWSDHWQYNTGSAMQRNRVFSGGRPAIIAVIGGTML